MNTAATLNATKMLLEMRQKAFVEATENLIEARKRLRECTEETSLAHSQYDMILRRCIREGIVDREGNVLCPNNDVK